MEQPLQQQLAKELEQKQQEQEPIATQPQLSRKETREFVTPFAFGVDDTLLGEPLASPSRRLVAQGIDWFCIAMLTTVSSLFLAGFAAFTFFRAGNRLKQKKRFNAARILLRFLAALLLFSILFVVVEGVNESPESNPYYNDYQNEFMPEGASLGEAIEMAANIVLFAGVEQRVQNGECTNFEVCAQEFVDSLSDDSLLLRSANHQRVTLAQEMLAEDMTGLDRAQMFTIVRLLNERSATLASELASAETEQVASPVIEPEAAEQNQDDSLESTAPATEAVGEDETKSPLHTVMAWVEGTIKDLGLGFGWAAFYFSVSTAWWKGQTPGKRVVGIKVVRLDGKLPNLWESFGRYGGYGAGLATGLLGFLQIFWDPNRQSIQDKISETLVINTRKFPRKDLQDVE